MDLLLLRAQRFQSKQISRRPDIRQVALSRPSQNQARNEEARNEARKNEGVWKKRHRAKVHQGKFVNRHCCLWW